MVGLKRRPSSTNSLKETKVRRTSSGRPKAADYDDSTKAILLAAISYYRANLSSYCAFPDITTEASMLAEIWKATLKIHETSATLTPKIAKLVKSSPLSPNLWLSSQGYILSDYEPRFPAPGGAQVEDPPSCRRLFRV